MQITGTHINYYFICHHKLWLFANGIQMEHVSDLVLEGKLIHEDSYLQRSAKYEEIELDGVKIDYFDPKKKVIHEVKKSNKIEKAHEWQLKYYIYVFEKNGIEGVTGLLEYPKIRITNTVFLSNRDKEEIETIKREIKDIISQNTAPEKTKRKDCKLHNVFLMAHHSIC